MVYLFKPPRIVRTKMSDEYWPEGDCYGHTVHEQEKQEFTGLYDHEGNEVHKTPDVVMGFDINGANR